MEILSSPPLTLTVDEVRRRLRMREEEHWIEVLALIEEVRPHLKPRAVYKTCYLDEKTEDSVVIEGITLKSRVLRKNLNDVQRVFAYVVTAGREMDELLHSTDDFLRQFYLDTIANVALNDTRLYLEDLLRRTYHLDGLSFMSPGSLTDWPISEQRPLFSLLGDVEAAIGVKLNDSLLMVPSKSVSGIFFPTEVKFYNCQLCPREDCTGRKAPFDRDLAEEYGVPV